MNRAGSPTSAKRGRATPSPLESLLRTPSNSPVNQALDPEHYPDLHLPGWGFGAWSEHLLKPEDPFICRRPMAAFHNDNAGRIIPTWTSAPQRARDVSG